MQAIDFMWRVEQMKTHAVHFAIALYDQHLLNLTNSTQAQICTCVLMCMCVVITNYCVRNQCCCYAYSCGTDKWNILRENGPCEFIYIIQINTSSEIVTLSGSYS